MVHDCAMGRDVNVALTVDVSMLVAQFVSSNGRALVPPALLKQPLRGSRAAGPLNQTPTCAAAATNIVLHYSAPGVPRQEKLHTVTPSNGREWVLHQACLNITRVPTI